MYCLNVLRQCGINWNTSQYELYPPDENDLPINEQIQLVTQIFNGTMRDTINIESAQDGSISETTGNKFSYQANFKELGSEIAVD